MKLRDTRGYSERARLVAAFEWVWPHVNMRAVYQRMDMTADLTKLSPAEWLLLKAELDSVIELSKAEGRQPRSLVGFTTRLRRPGE